MRRCRCGLAARTRRRGEGARDVYAQGRPSRFAPEKFSCCVFSVPEILLRSAFESEMANKWTLLPQKMVVDSGAAETVIPRTWFPNVSEGVFFTTADGSTVENEGDKR